MTLLRTGGRRWADGPGQVPFPGGRCRTMRALLTMVTTVAATVMALLVSPLAGAPVGATTSAEAPPIPSSTQAAPGAPASAAFTLLHGLESEARVDVMLDHRVCALRAVPFSSLSRRLSVPSGIHHLEVLRSDGQCRSGVTLVGTDFDAPSDAELTMMLWRGPDGTARLEHHAVDLSPLPRCEVRLSVYNLTNGALDGVVLRHLSQGWTALELSRLDPGQGRRTANVVDADYRLEARYPAGSLQTIATVPEGRVGTLYVIGDQTSSLQIVIDTRVSRNFTG